MENRDILIIVVAVIIAIGLFVPLGGNYGYRGMMGMMYNYGYGGMGQFGYVFMILLLVLVVLAIVWFVKQIQMPRSGRRK